MSTEFKPLNQDNIESAITDDAGFRTAIDAASSTQGSTADSALQPGDILTGGGTITPKSSGNLDFNDLGGTVDNAAVVTAVEEDPAAVVEALDLDPRAISDALNWQPKVMAKMLAWESGSEAPLRVVTIGDSLSTGIGLSRNMSANAGYIGMNTATGSSGVTENVGDVWITPVKVRSIAVGGTWIATEGATSSAATERRGNRAFVSYIKESGGGSFDVQFSSDGGSTWTNGNGGGSGTATTISCSNASTIGAVEIITLATSNAPAYRMRITNVTGAAVKTLFCGIYNTTGAGVIELNGVSNQAGLDLVSFQRVPDAVFTPIWTALAPDLALVCFADDGSEWETSRLQLTGGSTNSNTTINFSAYPARVYAGGFQDRPYPRVGDEISGTGIPAGTYITAHTEGTTTATISQAATGTASGLTFTIRGAWDVFYDRCKAAFADTDFVIVSQNPCYEAATSGVDAWQSGSSYVIGDTVVRTDGSLVTENSVFRCTSNHTAGASTEPGVGGSWATVWEVDLFNADAIAAGDTRAAVQASAQKAWAIANNESFLNGFALYRGYREGYDAGLMASDRIHPTETGHRWKNLWVWNAIPVNQLFWGSVGKYFAEPVLQMPFPGTASTSTPLESTRAVHIRQSTSGGIMLYDRQNTRSQAAAVQIFSDSATGKATMGSTSILEWNNFQSAARPAGIYPGSNNYQMGGASLRWNPFFASMNCNYAAKTADYTFTANDYTVDITANSPTITLPTAVGITGRIYIVANTGAGTVTMATTSSQTIDGAAPGTVAAGARLKVQSTGANWITIP